MKMFPKIPTINVKKYGGKQVAVVGGKIIASGTTTPRVLASAKKKLSVASWREIVLITVPKGITVVYHI